MIFRAQSLVALLTAALVAGCKEQTPIPHTPTQLIIVGGANQSGNLSAALDSSLVVQVRDGAGKSVSGVALAWTVIGGGSLSATTTTSDADGKSTVKWTLAPTAGTQVVTVTSAQMTGVSVSFVANNGAVISGSISLNPSQSPFAPAFSRAFASSAGRFARAGSSLPVPRYSRNRIVVGFRDDVLNVAAAGSMAYRSMATARTTDARVRQRLAALTASLPVSRALVSPVLLAARIQVDDTTRVEEIMATLRADPSVAYVERDAIITIRDRVSKPVRALATQLAGAPAASQSVATKLPNDANLELQYWNYNLIGLPRAWALTTGSANVVVAVIDMGIRFDDTGIAANLTNDGYDFVSQLASQMTLDGKLPLCDGTVVNTIDGDGDGPDADPTDPDDLEDTGDGCFDHAQIGDHGLWTAGIIGELGNNLTGGTGINWTVKIRPIRVLGVTGEGSNFDIAQGILYAAGLPAKGANGAVVQASSRAPIINLSLGGYGTSSSMSSAVAAAVSAGSLIIASSGNDAIDLPSYPASYPNVMAVSSVGPDGNISSFSNAGTQISVAGPGGESRLDFNNTDTGGDWVWGRWWDFTRNRAVYGAAIGTSASAPHVAGVAALLLAQDPTLTAAALRQRLEQFATRTPGATRNDNYGWGIVNAYNALTQQNGPAAQTYVRLIDAVSGTVARTTTASANGAFAFTRVATGSYYMQAGTDEAGDATIGVPGRRFTWAGGFGAPTPFNVNGNSQSVALVLGIPTEVEPNDDVAHANMLSVGSYVVGTVTTPDVRDVYSVTIPTAGQYTFETSGVVGACGYGVEMDTFVSVASAAGIQVVSNDNVTPRNNINRYCSRVQPTLQPGIYYVTVTGTPTSPFGNHGRYRLEVRAGP